MRTAIWWKGFWEQTLTGGETMVSVRLFGMKLDEMTSYLASLEARIAEVEGERDEYKRTAEMLNTNLQGSYETMEQSDKQWKADSDRAEAAENRLAEVVKRVAKLSIYTTVDGSGMDAHIVNCFLMSDVIAALAHAHEEEKHD